jgi:hypothetical protein
MYMLRSTFDICIKKTTQAADADSKNAIARYMPSVESTIIGNQSFSYQKSKSSCVSNTVVPDRCCSEVATAMVEGNFSPISTEYLLY